MIVRILGDGQYEVGQDSAALLEELDSAVEAALNAGDEAAFAAALASLDSQVRDHGSLLDPSTIVPSDLVLPQQGASLSEVRELLASEEVGT